MKQLLRYFCSEYRKLNRLERVIGSITVTVLFVLFTGQLLYSASISGTNVAAPVVPFDTADTYPTHNARYGKGGLVQWQTTTQCRAIPIQRRYTGMICYAATTDTWRYLKNGTANSNWQRATLIPQLGVDFFDGRTIGTLFGNISGGIVSHTWDSQGLNPTPQPLMYKARLWLNGVRITALRYFWAAFGHLRGISNSDTFTPSILGGYSSNRNTKVELYMDYSTTAGYGGKRQYTVTLPIASNKIGGIGATGAPGQDATVTRLAIHRAMSSSSASQSNDIPIQYRPASKDYNTVKQAYRDYSGYVRRKTDGIGYEYFMSRNQADIVKIMTNGTLALLLNSVTRLDIKNTGVITGYRSNGTVKFNLYTSVEPALGNPTVDAYCLKSTAAGVRSWGSCGTGGSGTPGGSDKQYQYNSGGSFAGSQFLRYTSNGVIIKSSLVIQ